MRYKAINRYTKKMIMEQELPPLEDDPAAGAEAPPVEGGAPPIEGGADIPPAPGADMPPAGGDLPPIDSTVPDTEEIDITDLVNMTKSIKKDLDDTKTNNDGVVTKMDDVFTKLNDLEQKLAMMDNIVAKIEQLGSKVEMMKEPTAVEKLEMRSLDSYPFNQKPQEFFAKKQGEMRASGKNEYELTKDDVVNYSQETIKDTFNPDQTVDYNEFKF